MLGSKHTEQKIFDAATELFLEKGVDRTSVREIAAKAGINLALMNYYFRSKENLFNSIFSKLLEDNSEELIKVLDSDLGLEEKIQKYVNEYIDMLLANPLLVSFVISILHRNWENITKNEVVSRLYSTKKFSQQLICEAKKGNIRNVNTTQFFVDMMSLIAFPFAIKFLIMDKAEINDEEFKDFVLERKKRVPQILINNLKPNS